MDSTNESSSQNYTIGLITFFRYVEGRDSFFASRVSLEDF